MEVCQCMYLRCGGVVGSDVCGGDKEKSRCGRGNCRQAKQRLLCSVCQWVRVGRSRLVPTTRQLHTFSEIQFILAPNAVVWKMGRGPESFMCALAGYMIHAAHLGRVANIDLLVPAPSSSSRTFSRHPCHPTSRLSCCTSGYAASTGGIRLTSTKHITDTQRA